MFIDIKNLSNKEILLKIEQKTSILRGKLWRKKSIITATRIWKTTIKWTNLEKP
jgi:hypothetical protein